MARRIWETMCLNSGERCQYHRNSLICRLKKDAIAIETMPLTVTGIPSNPYTICCWGYFNFIAPPFSKSIWLIKPLDFIYWYRLQVVASQCVFRGFLGSLRLEPVWTALGQASGIAAHNSAPVKKSQFQKWQLRKYKS